jgi:serine/threonine-protein kinase
LENDPSSVAPSCASTASADPRVQELVEQLFDSDATPEQVCVAYPELLPAVRDQWLIIRRLEGDLDALFPQQDERKSRPAEPEVIPQIPGYEVESVLGRGGMGIVFRAKHLKLSRLVALKMVHNAAYVGTRERSRFQREAEAVARLQHPNVVQIHDVGEAHGRPYFTMELVEGGNLAAKLTGTPLPAALATSLMATLAEAVHFAHQNGIVHRDLKPANILLTADGVPKITDFGLALRQEDEEGLTLSGVPMGTPSYMSPEQARGDKSAIGPATDVYSLGVMLYECLTGRPPFRGETRTATLRQVMTDEPLPPGQLNPAVPRDLQTICLKCLEKEPQKRYASAQALADDLHRFQRREPIMARPAGSLERAVKWARRRPTAATALAAALLMLVGISVVAVWYVGDRARQRAEAKSRDQLANAALDDAEKYLKDLRAKLDDAPQAWELLSEVDRWQDMVDHARQAWERAVAAVGNEAMAAEKTRARIQAVEEAVNREQAAFGLAKELDDIAVDAISTTDNRATQQRKAVGEYERFFARQNLDIHQPGTVWFASAIRSSPVRFALIAALDNWAWLAGICMVNDRLQSIYRNGVLDSKALLAGFIEDPRTGRLLDLQREADPDPWRDRFRHPAVWADRSALTGLAKEVDFGRQSPTVLTCFFWWLDKTGEDTTALLERAIMDHHRDFWMHRHAALLAKEPGLRVGHAGTTLAIRPGNVFAYVQLAMGLQQRGNLHEALEAMHRVVEIDPENIGAYYFLARLMATCPEEKVRDGKQAVQYATRACELTDWKDSAALDTLAAAHAEAGQFDEAVRYQMRVLEDPTLLDYLQAGAKQRLELYRQKKPSRDLGMGH